MVSVFRLDIIYIIFLFTLHDLLGKYVYFMHFMKLRIERLVSFLGIVLTKLTVFVEFPQEIEEEWPRRGVICSVMVFFG